MASLSDGSSQFFLQLQQQLHRRMMPSAPIPQTENELQAAQLSMLVYLERFGGYKDQRSLGMTMWLLAHCVDSAARGDLHACREHLAFTTAAIEQVAVDQGDWSLGFLQSLVAEPPITVFQQRQQHLATKDDKRDRQIGDRRGMNYKEDKVSGSSAWLPNAADITDLLVDIHTSRVHVAVCDRQDYYHQIWATPARARSNTLGPSVSRELLEGTNALNLFLLEEASRRRRKDRLLAGDHLHGGDGLRFPTLQDGRVCVAFQSILQGDHIGVEIACSAHEQLLRNGGLLPESELASSARPASSSTKLQGLVIDDYFSISIDEMTSSEVGSSKDFHSAKKMYQTYDIAGSDDKDVYESAHTRVIGAEINSSRAAVQNGVVTVGAPAQKRLSLSWVSLLVSSLPSTTDQLHLSIVGGWSSAMTCRRPFMGLFDKSYSLVKAEDYATAESKVIGLPRGNAEELVLASVLAPLILTDVSTPMHNKIFCTDASESRGAVLQADVDATVNEAIFKSFKTKGSYSRLHTKEEVLALRLGLREEDDADQEESPPTIGRPLAYRFDFVEVFAGSARITACMDKLGFSTCVPIELSLSTEFNVKMIHVQSWLCYLIRENLVRAFAYEPPCTTFSVMRRPSLRDRWQPFGYRPWDPQTNDGNILAHRGFQALHHGAYYFVPGLLETPNSSKMKFLPAWKAIEEKKCAKATRVDSCQYGSPHLKSFKLLSVHMLMKNASRRCKGGHEHLEVEGALTKASATYTWELAMAIAEDFKEAIQRIDVLRGDDDQKTAGLESFVVNEVALSSQWEVMHDWSFRRESHINLLELKAVLKLVNTLVLEKKKCRAVSLIDSNVCRCCIGKGRSSSRALSSILRRINVSCICGGILLTCPYVPTRWNTADDPTRLRQVRPPLEALGLEKLSRSDIFRLCRAKRLRRWASNWMRLVFILVGHHAIEFSDPTAYRNNHHFMDFDCTLAFPGEGPSVASSQSTVWAFQLFASSTPDCFRKWSCYLPGFSPFVSPIELQPHDLRGLCSSQSPPSGLWGRSLFVGPLFRFLLCLLCLSRGAVAMEMHPRNSGDFLRSRMRAATGPLPQGRIVLERTAQLRNEYLNVFWEWSRNEGIDIQWMLDNYRECIDEINIVLCRFGRKLYEVGRPRNHYIETINGITALKPGLRRMVQEAWDLGFAWSKSEPSDHHVAAPFQVLMALVATCFIWGWPVMAGCLSLMWGALLRPGELLATTRRELLLPKDVGSTIAFALVSIREPKTKHSAARHQAARLDIPDLLDIVQNVFYDFHSHQRLWSFSGQTLRNRFKQLLESLSLPSARGLGPKPLDLGSMRAGGATWLLEMTENGNLVQRRGRWVSEKVMMLYIQELTANIFLSRLDRKTMENILRLAHAFPAISEKAIGLIHAKIPCSLWYRIFLSA